MNNGLFAVFPSLRETDPSFGHFCKMLGKGRKREKVRTIFYSYIEKQEVIGVPAIFLTFCLLLAYTHYFYFKY